MPSAQFTRLDELDGGKNLSDHHESQGQVGGEVMFRLANLTVKHQHLNQTECQASDDAEIDDWSYGIKETFEIFDI